MNHQTRKNEEKTEWTSGAEKRQDFINKFGEKKFQEVAKKDKRYAELEFIPFPECYTWLVNQFFNIWKNCEVDMMGNKIFTPRQILDYCECFGTPMTYRERKMIMKMKEWAEEAIAELKREKEK